jgi:hypothetical protein
MLQAVSFPQGSPPKPCIHLSSLPYMLNGRQSHSSVSHCRGRPHCCKVVHPVSFTVAHPFLRRVWDDLSRYPFFFLCTEMVSHVTGSAEGFDSAGSLCCHCRIFCCWPCMSECGRGQTQSVVGRWTDCSALMLTAFTCM